MPYFLIGDVEKLFRAAQCAGSTALEGGENWPQAVQYLLRTYATPNVIRDAVSQARAISQKDDEDEVAYSTRLYKALYRCGNIFPQQEQITMFLDGLLPTTRTIVARHRES